MSIRKDVLKIDIQENAYFLVYHKNIDIGFGPTVGLYLYNIEYLKFDCFGQDYQGLQPLNIRLFICCLVFYCFKK